MVWYFRAFFIVMGFNIISPLASYIDTRGIVFYINNPLIWRSKFMTKKLLKKNILAIITALAMLLAVGAFIACDNVNTVFAWYEGDTEYGSFQLVLNAGETYTVRHERFQFLPFDFERIELIVYSETHDNVVSVAGNVIAAVNNGRAEIIAHVHRGIVGFGGRRYYSISKFRIGEVRVLDEATMTEIWTAQDLADIGNDLGGSFVLRADIDLADWGNWTPIGSHQRGEEFRGAFINPHEYSISNLTINNSIPFVGGDIRIFFAGLFAYLRNAFIDGLILENVNIVALHEDGARRDRAFVGGIAGAAWQSTILNTSVGGYLAGNHRVGGIVGYMASSEIISCSFNGKIKLFCPTISSGVGGIAGGMYGLYRHPWRWHRTLVADATVSADIVSYYKTAPAGGIVGISHSWLGQYDNVSNSFDIINSTFEGNLVGYLTGTKRGWAPLLDIRENL